jgi:glutaconate CoA-transferase subunit B
MKYMRVELLILTASREINDYDIVVIGQWIPMAAGAIAKMNHAPHSTILTEAGMIDLNIFQNMEDVGDPGCTLGYSYSIDLFDVFTTIVNRGYCDVCILGTAQLDKYGNINSTAIGGYDFTNRRNIKLSGSGGANEFAGHSNRTILTIVGGEFVKKLDYITSPGWLTGGDSRKKAGLPGGPTAVISKYGIFRFHENSKEMYLSGIFPKTTVEDIQKSIPWDLKIAEDYGKELEKIPPPKIEELKIIREFEPFFGIGAHEGRLLQSQVLPLFYERGVKNVLTN